MKENTDKKVATTAASNAAVLSAQDAGLTARSESESAAHFSTYIRTLLLNWRQGTVSSKGRSDVSFTNKKPWRQKGTGRARAGSARSPLWRGGGVTFGPQARTRTIKVPKSVRKQVMNQLIGQLFDDSCVKVVDWKLTTDVPKASEAAKMLKQNDLYDSKVVLFVANDDILTQRSFSNLANVRIVLFDQVNAFDLAHAHNVVVLKKDLDAFKEMVSQWN